MAHTMEKLSGQEKDRDESKSSKMHRRSRSGCFTCRLRRKKCSEEKPRCRACKNLGLDCEYKRPTWWTNNETRKKQKDVIKNLIKRTKSTEKDTTQSETTKMAPHASYPMAPPKLFHGSFDELAGESDSDDFDEAILDPTMIAPQNFYNPYTHQYYYPQSQASVYSQGSLYEVDVKTTRQMYINDVPTRQDTTTSTFTTCIPPPPHTVLPSFSGDDPLQQNQFSETPTDMFQDEEKLDFSFLDYSNGTENEPSTHLTEFEVEGCDKDLLEHLVQNVLPHVFPILDINQNATFKADRIMNFLQTNKAYLSSCLSVAAQHLKSTGDAPPTIDNDIQAHKSAFVSEVLSKLVDPASNAQILDATLGMISMEGMIGQAHRSDVDIPWHQHFQNVTTLVASLGLPQMLEHMPVHGHASSPLFNMTLTAWIDILGASMLGRAPLFADTYRTRHLAGGTMGLSSLMGCADNVMYLLGEIACLDSLQLQKTLGDDEVCSHVLSLGYQIDATESPYEIVRHPYSSSGSFKPKQVQQNITAIFRKAIRLYLCSLVPNFDKYGQAAIDLIQSITEMWHFIPDGPTGFDRSIVWPLLMAGANSVPGSPFRQMLAERTEKLGLDAKTGSFARLLLVLDEVWRRNDGVEISGSVCEATPITAGALSPTGYLSMSGLPQLNTSVGHGITPALKLPATHWRDVMREKSWDFLLI